MQQIQIDVFADVICPWCYIGQKRLLQALALRPDIQPEFKWRSFLLNPSMQPAGMDRQAYLNAKFGHAAAAVYGRIEEAGKEVGIDFQFDKITRTPNSRTAHQLIIAAEIEGYDLSEQFYTAYFLEGRDISSPDVQEWIFESSRCPLPSKESLHLASERMKQDFEESPALGIDGVPFMVFEKRLAIAGAHPPEVLVGAIDAARMPA